MDTPQENPFEQIQKFFKEFKGDINIINESIDVKLQLEYFELSQKIKSSATKVNWQENADLLLNEQYAGDNQKQLLSEIASVEEVKAFRFLEAYAKDAPEHIKHWSLLALQESRMQLQSKLLEQSQIMISTGLGGKGNMLRYFMVLFTKDGTAFSELQQKVVRSEFQYYFPKNESEVEEVQFHENMATLLVLVPLTIAIQDIFMKTLNEVNQFGNFVKETCIITNVRKMSVDEITTFLNSDDEPSVSHELN